MSDRELVYKEIYNHCFTTKFPDETQDKASRLSNRIAVKYTWEIYNLISGPFAMSIGDISDLLDRRSPMCILPPAPESSEFVVLKK